MSQARSESASGNINFAGADTSNGWIMPVVILAVLLAVVFVLKGK